MWASVLHACCIADLLDGGGGRNAAPVQSKDRLVNTNVNSIILMSLQDFGKLSRINLLNYDCVYRPVS